MRLTVSTFKIADGSSITQCRRWVRDALPAIDDVVMRGGKKRKFSTEEGLLVHIFGWLVKSNRADKANARLLVDIIRPWVTEHFSPIEELVNTTLPLIYWEIYAWRVKGGDLRVEARGRVKNDLDNSKTPSEYTEEGLIYVIKSDYKIPQSLEFPAGAHIIFPLTTWAIGFSRGLQKLK